MARCILHEFVLVLINGTWWLAAHQHFKRHNVYPVIVSCDFWPDSAPVRLSDWLRCGAGCNLSAPGRGSFRWHGLALALSYRSFSVPFSAGRLFLSLSYVCIRMYYEGGGSDTLSSASRQGYVCTTCTMSYFYGNKSTFLWIALLSTVVLEEDPRSGEEVMFSTGTAPVNQWRCIYVCASVGIKQGGVQAVEGAVGKENSFLTFLNKLIGTLFCFVFIFKL